MVKLYFVFLLLFSFSISAFSEVFYSHKSGDWRDKHVWETNHHGHGHGHENDIPKAGDIVHILRGHEVKVTHNMDLRNSPVSIIIDGTLRFDRHNTSLRLACGSTINLGSSGCITSHHANHDNQIISICGISIWNSNSGTVCGPNTYGEALPVELVYFHVKNDSSNIKIAWLTASEINNDFFVVERSLDGETWEEVQTVYVHGSTNEHTHYIIYDHTLYQSVVYYRLKQVDFDGTATYSTVVNVYEHFNTDTNSGVYFINSFPIPCQSENALLTFSISSDIESKAELVFRDVKGQEILRGDIKLEPGLNNAHMDVTNLKAGTYNVFLSVNYDNRDYQTVVIQ